jgi:tRNA-splicing ligase RtcB
MQILPRPTAVLRPPRCYTDTMDYRNVLRRIDQFRLELPLDYKDGMRVPGMVYADERLMKYIAEDQSV